MEKTNNVLERMLISYISKIVTWFKDTVDSRLPCGVKRSSVWPRIRAEYLKEHPVCECCGGDKSLEIHHKKPFHLWPELELTKDNLMTLCEKRKCHITFGHLFSYQSFNPNVETDVLTYNKKAKGRP